MTRTAIWIGSEEGTQGEPNGDANEDKGQAAQEEDGNGEASNVALIAVDIHHSVDRIGRPLDWEIDGGGHLIGRHRWEIGEFEVMHHLKKFVTIPDREIIPI
jgi:hypothetical protein